MGELNAAPSFLNHTSPPHPPRHCAYEEIVLHGAKYRLWNESWQGLAHEHNCTAYLTFISITHTSNPSSLFSPVHHTLYTAAFPLIPTRTPSSHPLPNSRPPILSLCGRTEEQATPRHAIAEQKRPITASPHPTPHTSHQTSHCITVSECPFFPSCESAKWQCGPGGHRRKRALLQSAIPLLVLGKYTSELLETDPG